MVVPQILAGAIAGCVATAPMTAAMEMLHQRLPQQERYPLPPSEITAQVTDLAGISPHLNNRQHIALTLAAHFAYGALAGAIYAPLASRLPRPPALAGIMFGLAVWSGSYLGLLPAVRILRPATQHPPRRNALMIAAHIIWGATTGILTPRLHKR